MTKPTRISIESFVTAAINSGGQMMIMISSMGQAIEQSPDHEPADDRIDEELLPILAPRLRDRPDAPADADLEAAARVLAWATEALGEDIFGAEPGRPHSTWVPEVHARVRRFTDDELEARHREELRTNSAIPEELDFLGLGHRRAG